MILAPTKEAFDRLSNTSKAEVWVKLTPAQREKLRDESELHPLLKQYIGVKVKVRPKREFGRSTFIVGRSSGWRPILLAMHSRVAHGSSDVIRANEKIDRVVVLD